MASQEQSFATSTSSPGSMTDEDVEPSQEDFVPKPRGAVWYEGGNVIVVSDKEKFCVHASILSRVSPTLRNMVSSARKIKQGRHVYSVIEFQKGNPMEVEHLLRAIYRPSLDFIRYDVSGAQQKAINYLTSIYPADLYDFKGREKDCCLTESIERRLVLKFGFDFDQENILYEWIRDQCFTSRAHLVKERHRMMSSVVSTQSPQCVMKCPDRRARHIMKTGVLLDDCPAIPDLDWFQDLDKKCGLCAHCQTDVLKLVKQGRLEFWGRLPEIFDLDNQGMNRWTATVQEAHAFYGSL